MPSIASDTCDYDMGDYDCDDEGYGCEDDGDYGGYDNSHDQEPNGNESYYSGGEYEENGEHSSYGEDGEEPSCGSSYGDEGAGERSYSHSESEDGSYDDAGTCYTSHSQDEGKVTYNTLLCKKYEEHAPKACEDSYSYSCTNPYPSRSSVCGYTNSSQSHPRGRRKCATLRSKDTISYTSHGNEHLLGYVNQGRYEDSYVGINMMNGGTQVPAKEPTVEGVMDALMGCPNIQGKEDLSCERQGTLAKPRTFTIANEQSVNVSLSLTESIDSLPYKDNVLVENVDTLVDPIDDRIDFSSKIDLCPPSVDTYALNANSLFCNDCVDQPVCECSLLVEGSCNVIKKPQFGGTNDNVDHLNRSDSLSMSCVDDPITPRDYPLDVTRCT
uniref:Uncharacterized histidine-rich protein DDB_G0274557 n=1 Tax=Solanum tuberosum TaxID=4113 RepID=M1DSG6_SOLTU